MQSNLAPIGISTYSRIHHLQKTVEALKNNLLASQSELFIFSDAPKAGDEEIVNKVRSYIHTISGFKKIHIIERTTNGRVKNNRGGIQYLLDTYGKCIFMEDDIVTAPGFLSFVNKALETYEENEKILSITGYSPPIQIPGSYQKDFFVLSRFNGWGAGFWKKKYDLIEQKLDTHAVREKLEDRDFLKKLTSHGMDMLPLLDRELSGEIDALDIKIMYQQALKEWYTIYPRQSLVQNIGHDGSGVHCGVSDKYEVEVSDKTDFIFDDNIGLDPEIVRENFKFRFLFNEYSMAFLVEGLIRKLKQKESRSFSVWGIGKMTQLLVANVSNLSMKINDFMDSSADMKELTFEGVRVITPETALLKGERTFVVASWENRIKLQDILTDLAKKHDIEDIEIIVPEISFP